eukprot:Ihof_evm1s461 gene=Ihof_evmTU1s461
MLINDPGRQNDEGSKTNREIDQELKVKKAQLAQEVKLLLLGAGESGKSTVLKQMKVIHSNGFSVEDRSRYIPAIYSHVMSSIQVILLAMDQLHILLEDESNQQWYDVIKDLPVRPTWSDSIYQAITHLWLDKGVQRCFTRANEYQLNDNADYFFNHLDTIAASTYIPSDQDIIRLRVQTTGILESKFHVGHMIFHMFDVGGQRSERRKWLVCFGDVTAVIFLVAISSYDQSLREDSSMNRLQEALELFNTVWTNRYLQSVSIILLLNKIDLLKDKLGRSELKQCFPDYTGGSSYAEVTKFIEGKFMKVAANTTVPGGKQVYPHFICAIDTEI